MKEVVKMKFTVITGASGGIGKALAYEFAKNGHNIIAIARSKDKLSQLRECLESDYKVKVIPIVIDLSEQEEVRHLIGQLEGYDLEILINNAGLGDYSYSWQQDRNKASKMIDINIKALTTLSLYFIEKYCDSKATLINVSSGGGYFVFNKAVSYCASKFYVSSFTEGIAQNLITHKKSLRAKILCPGGTNTGFVAASESQFKGKEIFDMDNFMEAETLAVHTYDLYKSDKIIGMVTEGNQFELRDPIFPFG